MADFEDGTTTKTATRRLSSPIADATAFNAIVQAVVVSNPFGCVSYMSGGATHAPVEKTREWSTAKIVYQDEDANVVGMLSDRYSTPPGSTPGSRRSWPQGASPPHMRAHLRGTPTGRPTPRPSSATTRTARSTPSASAATG